MLHKLPVGANLPKKDQAIVGTTYQVAGMSPELKVLPSSGRLIDANGLLFINFIGTVVVTANQYAIQNFERPDLPDGARNKRESTDRA